MKRLSLLFLILVCGILGASAQNGYIITDSVKSIGVHVINQGDKMNARFCVVENARERSTYKPTEVIEYRIGLDEVYVSRQINKLYAITQVFLRRDVEGKINLMANLSESNPTLFVEGKNLPFTELKKGDEFREQLRGLTADCEDVTVNLPLVKYNRGSVKRYITDYNNCRKGFFPHQRIGVYGLYEVMQIKNHKYNVFSGLLKYAPDHMVSAGIFADIPIYHSSFSIHPEVQYSIHKTANTFIVENNTTLDFIEERKTLKFPVLLRYMVLSNKVRPFANFGPTAAYNISYEGDSYKSFVDGNVITIEGETIRNKSSIYPGISAGIGAEVSINLRFALFAEVRYNYFFPSKDILKYSDTQFVTGIIF